MHKLTITALFAFICIALNGQSPSLEVGPTVGFTYYQGDVNPWMPFQNLQPAGGFMLRYSNSTRWAYRLNLLGGQLKSHAAQPRVDIIKGAKFKSDFQEVSLVAEFNFFDYFTGSDKNYLTNYMFGGLGLPLFKSKEGVKPITTMGKSLVFGLGMKYSLGNHLALGVETGLRWLFSGDVFHNVPLPSNDPGTRDWYNYTGISLSYRFSLSKKQKCDAFKSRVHKK